jgi:hypothetical protein
MYRDIVGIYSTWWENSEDWKQNIPGFRRPIGSYILDVLDTKCLYNVDFAVQVVNYS